MSQVTSTLQRKLEKAGKCILINPANPQYQVMINQFEHLKDIQMNDIDTKSPLPLHEILGASEQMGGMKQALNVNEISIYSQTTKRGALLD